jgi:hypothetical protein
MNREGLVRTVSITCVVRRPEGFEMVYEELLSGEVTREVLPTERE